MRNQRRHRRARARDVVAHVQMESGLLSCVVENISSGGAFLRTDRPLPVGAPLVLNLVRPGMKKALHVAASVANVRGTATATRTGSQPGMGIRFENLDEETGKRLARLLVDLVGSEGYDPPPPDVQDAPASPSMPPPGARVPTPVPPSRAAPAVDYEAVVQEMDAQAMLDPSLVPEPPPTPVPAVPPPGLYPTAHAAATPPPRPSVPVPSYPAAMTRGAATTPPPYPGAVSRGAAATPGPRRPAAEASDWATLRRPGTYGVETTDRFATQRDYDAAGAGPPEEPEATPLLVPVAEDTDAPGGFEPAGMPGRPGMWPREAAPAPAPRPTPAALDQMMMQIRGLLTELDEARETLSRRERELEELREENAGLRRVLFEREQELAALHSGRR